MFEVVDFGSVVVAGVDEEVVSQIFTVSVCMTTTVAMLLATFFAGLQVYNVIEAPSRTLDAGSASQFVPQSSLSVVVPVQVPLTAAFTVARRGCGSMDCCKLSSVEGSSIVVYAIAVAS